MDYSVDKVLASINEGIWEIHNLLYEISKSQRNYDEEIKKFTQGFAYRAPEDKETKTKRRILKR